MRGIHDRHGGPRSDGAFVFLRPRSFRSWSVGGSVHASSSAGSGTTAIVHIVVVRLVASASAPSPAAASPPKPIAAPIVIPDARPSRFGRYSWPITTVIEKFAMTRKPTPTSSAVAGHRPTSRNSTSSGPSAAIEPTTITRRPTRSTSRPPT